MIADTVQMLLTGGAVLLSRALTAYTGLLRTSLQLV